MVKFGKYLVVTIFVMSLIGHIQALKMPNEYDSGQCDIIAKDFQAKFGGWTVFLQSDTYPDQIGHFLNKKRIGGKIYYIDWGHQRIFDSKEAVLEWYIDSGIKTGTFTDAIMVEDAYDKDAQIGK